VVWIDIVVAGPLRDDSIGIPRVTLMLRPKWVWSPMWRENLSRNSGYATLHMIPELVFPKADRANALLVEKFSDLTVTLAVAVDFSFPKLTVRLWDVPAFTASVPEAAVHENGQLS
jgi:hypothetical protein